MPCLFSLSPIQFNTTPRGDANVLRSHNDLQSGFWTTVKSKNFSSSESVDVLNISTPFLLLFSFFFSFFAITSLARRKVRKTLYYIFFSFFMRLPPCCGLLEANSTYSLGHRDRRTEKFEGQSRTSQANSA